MKEKVAKWETEMQPKKDKIESTQKSSENPLIKEIYSVQIFHYRNPVIISYIPVFSGSPISKKVLSNSRMQISA